MGMAMKLTRRTLALGAGASALLGVAPACAQNPTPPPRRLSAAALDAAIAPSDGARPIIHLWPNDRPPGGFPRVRPIEQVLERSQPPALRDRAVTHVERPRLVMFRPENPNGASLLYCPGGGYARCVLDKESYESIPRFMAAGITCFVLIYRLPGDHWAQGPDASLADAQRAIRIIRARAAQWGLNPQRAGVLGFSAGGHVAGSMTVRWDAQTYARTDATDDQPTKPDLSLLLYPVISMMPAFGARNAPMLLGEGGGSEADRRARSLELCGRPDTPPTFIAAAADDDTIPIENSVMMYEALHAAHVSSELHVFETGGHGFGIRFTPGKPTAAWPDLALTFLRGHGFAA